MTLKRGSALLMLVGVLFVSFSASAGPKGRAAKREVASERHQMRKENRQDRHEMRKDHRQDRREMRKENRQERRSSRPTN